MRYGSTARRMRNGSNSNAGSHRGGGHTQQRRGIQNKNKVFDSNGPDVRIRGTAYQIVEKYQALAKDAGSAGDRVLAENYLQYAEHYQRMINGWEEEDAYYDSIELQNADERQNNAPQEQGSLGAQGVDDEEMAGLGTAAQTAPLDRPRQHSHSRSTRSPARRTDQNTARNSHGQSHSQNDDLGLPASILGQAPVAKAAKTANSAVVADTPADMMDA